MKKLFFFIILVLAIGNLSAQRRMENLGRGVVATRTGTSSIFINWRLFGNDPNGIGFNLYRSTAGGEAVKINTSVLTAGTNYTDNSAVMTSANSYFVKPVLKGVEQAASGAFTLSANHAIEPCVVVPLKAGNAIHFVWVGDLDGDGEYDYIVDRLDFTNGGVKVEAYKNDGTYLWTMDMGPNSLNLDNISPGSSTIDVGNWDGLTVYDMDGDGKAEVMVRTANGVVFGDGTTLVNANNNVQYISVLNGLTGAERARVQLPTDYLATGPLACSMGIGYLDGVKPSLVTFMKNRNADGSFNRLMCAWDFNGTTASLKWKNNLSTVGGDGHQMRILDYNGDGKDDVGEIGFVLKNDGTTLYNLGDQNIWHGDRWHVGKLDPNRPGLQGYGIQQDNSSGILEYYYDAGTGKVLWKHTSINVGDVGRGEAGDIDANNPGYEVWSFSGLYNGPTNTLINAGSNPYPNFRIWWDGDVLSENYDDGKIDKHLGGRLLTAWTFNSATGSDRNAPMFYGDIFGDWREEVVMTSSDYSKLVIFTTPNPTTTRLYTLPHNPEYRNCMTVKGYMQSHMIDYYLGAGMTTPPTPPMQSAKSVWKGNVSNNIWDVTSTNWVVNGATGSYTEGDNVMFDISGAPDTLVQISGAVAPTSIKVISPINYTFGGTGSISGSTGILKSGNGALSLNVNSDYTDTTRVEEGSFYMNGNLTQSKVIVSFMATIGGSGTITKQVTLNAGAFVSPGAKSNVGNLTFYNDLTLPAKSTCIFDITNDSTGLIKPSDKIVINGNLTIAGIAIIQINKFNSVVKPGTYPLIAYTGTFTGDMSKVTVTGLFGQKFALTNTGGVISLTIEGSRTAKKVVWDGTATTWDLQTTPAWQLDNSQVTFVPNDSVVFDSRGSLGATVKVVGTLPVNDLRVETDSCNYYFSGTGNIGGTGGLTKNGSGLLTMLATNSYAGKTTVNGGKMIISAVADAGAPSSIGAYAGTDPSGLVLNNAYLRWLGSTNTTTNRGLTLAGVNDTIDIPSASIGLSVQGLITGTGNLVKIGAGTLNVQKSLNTFKNTIVKAGILSLGDETANTNGIGTGTLTLDGGALTMYSNTGSYNSFNNNIVVPALSKGTLNTDARCNYNGTLTGGGTLTVYLPGSTDRTIFFGNWSAFTGTINVTGVASSKFRIANSYGYAAATINLGDNTAMYHGGTGTNGGDAVATTVNIGALSGSSTSSIYGDDWVIGSKNIDATYSGNISGNSLTKVGTGNFTLTDTCFYTANTIVNGGKLTLSTYGCIKGPVIVNNGATIAGIGNIQGSTTIMSGGTLSPGLNTIGKLNFSSNLTLAAGSNTVIEAKKLPNGNDIVSSTGTITFNGTLNIANIGTTAFAVGDSIVIFKAAKYAGAFTSIVPETPGDGLVWDITTLNTRGVINVTYPVSVKTPADLGITIVPNPVKDNLRITFKTEATDTYVNIYSLSGTLLYNQKAVNKQMIIPMEKIQSGVYIIKLSTPTDVTMSRIVKQ